MKSFNLRVWEGDPKTVEESRERYREDPEGELISHACVLYSFRDRADAVADELRELLKGPLAVYTEALPPFVTDQEKTADEADMLSTWYLWSGDVQRAQYIAEYGLRFAHFKPEQGDNHSWCFLKLNLVQIYCRTGDNRKARKYFQDILHYQRVSDPNQRSRVCRKISITARMLERRDTALQYGIQACLVRGITRRTRLKSAAALFGFGY